MTLAELLAGRAAICDGAMGTMLHAAGAALDRSLPELNLSDPGLVATIHDSYLSAGADIIQTNTFGANRVWLGDHGFPDKVHEINRAGVRLACQARRNCDRDVLVAGSVSPGVTAAQRRRIGEQDRMEAIREQVLALVAEPGLDLIILETFGYLDELVEAVSVASSVCDLPVVAQATFADDAHTLGGETPREVATVLGRLPVAAIGTNCTIGPQRMLAVAEDLVRHAPVPVTAQPNAGQPRRTGRRSFEFSIDGGYFARYLRRFADAGVSVVGGCCGTTPTHIRAAAGAVRSPARNGRRLSPPRAAQPVVAGTLADRLASGTFVTAAAIAPPSGLGTGDMIESLRGRGVGVFAVDEPEMARTHLDALDMALRIQSKTGTETIATVTAWEKSIMTLQADLLGAHALGIRAVICATGSPPVLGDYPAVDGVWDVDSLGLVALLAGLNEGRDCNGLPLGTRTSFCVGARVDPGAADLDTEAERARAKVDAGAHFLVSRPVYDIRALRRLTAALGGVSVPLLLSVSPLRSFEEADYLANEVPGVQIPAATLHALEAADHGEVRAVGVRLATELLLRARDLVAGVIVAAGTDAADLLGAVSGRG